jgi:hypothetical protein
VSRVGLEIGVSLGALVFMPLGLGIGWRALISLGNDLGWWLLIAAGLLLLTGLGRGGLLARAVWRSTRHPEAAAAL